MCDSTEHLIIPFLRYLSFFHLKTPDSLCTHRSTCTDLNAHFQNITPFFSHKQTHTYTREAADCSVWTLNWFPLHYPAIGHLMLREAREMEEGRGLQLQKLLSIFCTHAQNRVAELPHKHMQIHVDTYHHTKKYVENIFVFRPINMHMKVEKAVFSAVSPKTQPIIAQQPLCCLSALHTCRNKVGSQPQSSIILLYTSGRKCS